MERGIRQNDTSNSPGVAVVNESFVKEFFYPEGTHSDSILGPTERLRLVITKLCGWGRTLPTRATRTLRL